MVKKKINIAIDGPVACGKTTIGKKLAQQFNYQFLDSGLLFRHFAWFCQEFWNKNSSQSLVTTRQKLNIFLYENGEFNKEQVVELSSIWQKEVVKNQQEFVQKLEKEKSVLSLPEISDLASQLSPVPELRKIILAFQRALTKEKGWVVVGRDITSEVLPQAEVKIFLTASLDTRVKRRYQEQQGKTDLLTVKEELLARDERDKKRPISPLKKTIDSWEIDNTNLTPEESVEKISQIILKTVWTNN